jgi:hypothetical protein
MTSKRLALVALTAAMLFAASASAGNGQNLISNLPQNSSVVFSVDVEQVRSTPVYQMLWGLLSANPEAQEVLTQMESQAGFNPNEHIRTLTFALGAEDQERFAVLIEGTFDVARITTFLSAADAGEMATMDYQGHTVYHDPTETGDDKPYFTFVNDSLFAIGTQTELGAVLDAVGGGANLTANADLNAVVSSTDKSGAFWFAGVVTPSMAAEMVGTPMATMRTMSGGGTLSPGFQFNYNLGTDSAESAAALSAVITEGLTQARTAPEVAQMGLTSMLDGVTVTTADTSVNIAVSIPENTVNQIMGMLTAIIAAQGM